MRVAPLLIAAALTLAGCWVDAGRPPGWSQASSVDVNKAGVVVAAAHTSVDGMGRNQSYLRDRSGSWVPIGVEGQDAVLAIDESGNAVGYAASLTGDGTACAAIWPEGEPARCLTPPHDGPLQDYATDINEHGVVVGQSGGLPAMWTATGEVQTLPLARPADTWGQVEAINTHGVMVGMVGTPEEIGVGHAVRWDSPTSAPVVLEADPGALDSLVWAISDNGVMVGAHQRCGR